MSKTKVRPNPTKQLLEELNGVIGEQPPTIDVQKKFQTARQEMCNTLVERDAEIDLCLVALLAKQHTLLVGPPGSAKSLLVESIRKWIVNSKSLTIHCCKDTTRAVAFGPIKLTALQQDKCERNLEGGAADVHFLILEECFKAGPAVLDQFLMILNERVYREGLVQANTPLKMVLGVSNEWSPEGCEAALGAFFDRFLLRKAVESVKTNTGLSKLLALPVAGKSVSRNHNPRFSQCLTLAELEQANQKVLQLEFTTEAGETYLEIIKQLRKEGISPGDRRLKLAVTCCQALAYLRGSDKVNVEHLEVLKDVLWVDPTEQPQKCSRVVLRLCNPAVLRLQELASIAEDVISNTPSLSEAIVKLESVKNDLTMLPVSVRRNRALDHVISSIKEFHLRLVINPYAKEGE